MGRRGDMDVTYISSSIVDGSIASRTLVHTLRTPPNGPPKPCTPTRVPWALDMAAERRPCDVWCGGARDACTLAWLCCGGGLRRDDDEKTAGNMLINSSPCSAECA